MSFKYSVVPAERRGGNRLLFPLSVLVDDSLRIISCGECVLGRLLNYEYNNEHFMKLKGGKLGINWEIMSIIAGHHH